MSTFSQFFPAAGGGGLTPKFQDFTSSGTFTPTQALIDAGGYIEVFIVGGGGKTTSSSTPASGGEAQLIPMYLTSTSSVSVTVGIGATLQTGGTSQFLGGAAGGSNISSGGGKQENAQTLKASPSWGNRSGDTAAGNGFFGYGAGGTGISGEGGIGSAKTNSGQAGGYSVNGGSGFVRVMWYE
jgi:hypothetical protein